MDRRVKNRLPLKAKALVDEIEAISKSEIRIERDTAPMTPNSVNHEALGVEVGASSATIFYRTEDQLMNPRGIVHELLHIQRYWMEGVPQILAKNSINVGASSSIEATLEHDVIIPREESFGLPPEDPNFWSDGHQRNLQRLEDLWKHSQDPDKVRFLALLGWISVTRIPQNKTIIGEMRKFLIKTNLLSEAEHFKHRVRTLLRRDKVATLRFTLDALHIPRSETVLLYLDPKLGKRVTRSCC
jgi:hypothetical protein